MKVKALPIVLLVIGLTFTFTPNIEAADDNDQNEDAERMILYKEMDGITHVPWYWLAAIDAHERGLNVARNDREENEGLIDIYYSPRDWVGALNPDLEDNDSERISIFGGVGLDGDADGIADRKSDRDVLYTVARQISSYGYDDENIRIALWDRYQRDQAVRIISGHAKIFKEYGTIALDDSAFPVPLNYNYTYNSTWGAARGWGGRRIHEGTDIFAGHSTPVRATKYGIVELQGWNTYGGWRIGIRDTDNVYHYFAHLSSFADGIEEGAIVEPGMEIGKVGSSGYGKPGTEGKFPPHLHYGLYRDNGYSEWSFDPYPSLKSWEKKERENS
ncbi:murein DD-endopeptidase MepM/ murein hydrolase activator NlpD [Geomicrobium halophilum]|uniref:Murein DD-endopeptidase MepM/ murein hydrolase activator NlpD n=1 Tax=Geomicrobium halophilum TaxID=549000 RepID=A0A841PZM3_9BACL|nr:M23 family metallopeptidase [Geomicrobium halophilum]MBB6450212.1 murein DD-endopeptidase MepM/ murein hydrolase activator NlpD [Geomicrobium halophilum]